MKKNKTLKVLSCLVLVSGLALAAVKGPHYDDLRSMGMGNTTVAVTTDRTAIFHNPAGLSLLKDRIEVSISPLIFSIDGKFGDMARAMAEHGDKLTDLTLVDDSFIEMINDMDGKWVGLEYLPEITIASKNIGFGVYSTFPLGMRIESGHLIPKLGLRGQRDLVFTWAVGVPLKTDKIHMGISVEYLQRTPVDEVITTYAETFNYFDEISAGGSSLGIIGDFADVQHGVSFDVGFMHDFNGFRIAYDIKDLLGVVGGKIVAPPQLDFGFAYYFPQMEDVKAIDNLILALEFSDIFGIEPVSEKFEHPLKKLHLGAELDMHYAALRAGLNQGYPTAGIGLRFGIIRLDYVYFTKELGYYPGQFPKQKHVLSLGVGFDMPRPKREGEAAAAAPSKEEERIKAPEEATKISEEEQPPAQKAVEEEKPIEEVEEPEEESVETPEETIEEAPQEESEESAEEEESTEPSEEDTEEQEEDVDWE